MGRLMALAVRRWLLPPVGGLVAAGMLAGGYRRRVWKRLRYLLFGLSADRSGELARSSPTTSATCTTSSCPAARTGGLRRSPRTASAQCEA
jgi:hypothetical protein